MPLTLGHRWVPTLEVTLEAIRSDAGLAVQAVHVSIPVRGGNFLGHVREFFV